MTFVSWDLFATFYGAVQHCLLVWAQSGSPNHFSWTVSVITWAVGNIHRTGYTQGGRCIGQIGQVGQVGQVMERSSNMRGVQQRSQILTLKLKTCIPSLPDVATTTDWTTSAERFTTRYRKQNNHIQQSIIITITTKLHDFSLAKLMGFRMFGSHLRSYLGRTAGAPRPRAVAREPPGFQQVWSRKSRFFVAGFFWLLFFHDFDAVISFNVMIWPFFPRNSDFWDIWSQRSWSEYWRVFLRSRISVV